MRTLRDWIDRRRPGSTELENHLIDELIAGRIGRREFIRRGSVIGASGALLAGVGAGLAPVLTPAARAATGQPGGTIRIASDVPATSIDPITVEDSGGLCMLCQTGEFLIYDDPTLKLHPMLALSWSPNKDSTVWTFKLRQGVKFTNGKPFNADCVVTSIDRLADPKNASNALSVFRGVLSKGKTKKIDEYTVAFHLDAPHGNFPYSVSSDNYNAIMLPADYTGDYEKTFVGTGPFKLERYLPKQGATFVRNDDYWGPKALPDRLEFSFYSDQQPQILALQGGQIDVMQQLVVQGGQALLNNPDINVIKLHASTHRQVHMRCDIPPFNDKRIRQALALTLDREAIVKGLFRGLAQVGNDSPFAPVFPSTNTSVPQRKKDIAKAKQLMQAAGKSGGFEVTLTSEQYQEIPSYAVLIQNAAKEIGIKINLKLETQSAYYGTGSFGKSDWLDSTLGITDYGHRGTPDLFLAAPLLSNGAWNAAHFKNPAYDKLVAQYVATADLHTQRDIAGKIETLLLDETPIIFAYFYDYLTATGKNVTGVGTTALSQLFLAGAKIS